MSTTTMDDVGKPCLCRLRISIRRFTHDQIISQQVSKGFELLGQQGSDKLVVRLGGIYALEGVMNTSEP
jgi:hypothetical protein